MRRQPELGRGQVGQDVDRVGHHQEDRLALEPRPLHLAEDIQEQLDVAIDQVKPAFVGLTPQAGGDQDQVALGDCLIAGSANALVGDERRAVQQVERLALAQVGVDVDQIDRADDPAALQGKGLRTIRRARRRR